uniref:Uncharacterized protein n=1 Tax=Arundo donax TaxID=35708 RepID=A0A0A9AL98_ARUDO
MSPEPFDSTILQHFPQCVAE